MRPSRQPTRLSDSAHSRWSSSSYVLLPLAPTSADLFRRERLPAFSSTSTKTSSPRTPLISAGAPTALDFAPGTARGSSKLLWSTRRVVWRRGRRRQCGSTKRRQRGIMRLSLEGALRGFESDECVLMPSSDRFKGFSRFLYGLYSMPPLFSCEGFLSLVLRTLVAVYPFSNPPPFRGTREKREKSCALLLAQLPFNLARRASAAPNR